MMPKKLLFLNLLLFSINTLSIEKEMPKLNVTEAPKDVLLEITYKFNYIVSSLKKNVPGISQKMINSYIVRFFYNNINLIRMKDKLTLLHAAVFYNRYEVVKLLIALGVDINAQMNFFGRNNVTPLMLACAKGYLEITKLLIGRGADTEVKDSFGYSAIMLSAYFGQINVFQYLHNYLDINLNSEMGSELLKIWIEFGLTNYVRSQKGENILSELN